MERRRVGVARTLARQLEDVLGTEAVAYVTVPECALDELLLQLRSILTSYRLQRPPRPPLPGPRPHGTSSLALESADL